MIMKKREKPTKWLWLDMEMTGLVATKDRILEVATIITDTNFKELATYEAVIQHDENSLKNLLSANDFWSKADINKTLQRNNNGISEKKAEKELVMLVEKYYLPGETVYLAGNTIRADRAFIDQWMPDFAKILHYRMLDVSAFKLWWVAQGGREFTKKELHRALPDIRESIAELKYYSNTFKSS